jgi:uncharacterized protein (TIGR02722 family)
MFIKAKNVITLSIIFILFISCGPSRKVSRIGADETTDISGRWNDTDSRLTAKAMISDVLSRPWLSDFAMDNDGDKPVVIVGAIRNKSSEHIPINAFVKDIERELVNSGKVTFVASKQERQEVREERMDQQSHSSLETASELAQETGADFMLKGVLSSIVDKFEGQKVVYYQIDMELIDLTKNTKVWMGNKRIKKFIEQAGSKW